ncbi:MAG: tetratricopeptide repeat protein [Planctomycetota bacterium]
MSSDVINTVDASFETDVMVRSQLGLVIVDFWADWCAPCRMLAPVLEEVVQEFGDEVTLVKADTEQNPQAAGQFGVSGIPAVFAVLAGRIVDAFQGAMPAPAIREWIEGCLAQHKTLQLEQRMETDAAGVETELRQLLEDDPKEATKVMLLQALYRQGKVAETQELLATLEARGFLEPECEQIRAELNLQGDDSVDVEELRAALMQAPEDLATKFRLAEALASQKQYTDAFEICLELVQVDRKSTGEQARLLMLDVFKVLGDDSELTRDYRRKLSMVLY